MEEAIIPVFGMERILPAPNGQRLNLTDFQLPKDQRHALVSQGALWSYFDRFLHVPSKVPPKAKEKSKLNKENGKKVVKKKLSKSSAVADGSKKANRKLTGTNAKPKKVQVAEKYDPFD